MAETSERETWRRITRTSALMWSFGVAAVAAVVITALNAVTGGGLGLITPWLVFFTAIWPLQLLHLWRWRPVGEAGATVHLLLAVTTVSVDGALQPEGFWQWVCFAVLQAVAVLAGLCLSPRRAAVVGVAASAGLVVVIAHAFDDPLLRWTASSALVASVLAPAAVVFVLTQRLEQLWEQSGRAATTDPLTRLANRAGLSAQVSRVVADATEHDQGVCVALLDVDHFKRVNDTCGHAAGDAVLVAVADALRAVAREGDAVARTGGEELLVVSRVSSAQDVEVLAERLRLAVADIALDGLPRVTASVGTATAARPEVHRARAGGDRGAQDLLERLSGLADAAMYVAKESGRDRVHHSSSGNGAIDHDALSTRPDATR